VQVKLLYMKVLVSLNSTKTFKSKLLLIGLMISRKLSAFLFILIVVFLVSINPIFAHGDVDDGDEQPVKLKADLLAEQSLNLTLFALVLVFILVIVALSIKTKSNRTKWALFLGIIIPVLFVTIYVASSTVYINFQSESGGPVHWHADFEIWNCGEKLDIIDPKGLTNRVGTPVFHEHGDDRIHLEGVVTTPEEADLHNFIGVIGGSLSNDKLSIPVHDGLMTVNNGDLCNGSPGKLQVFLFKVTNPDPSKNTGFLYEQIKLEDNFKDYVLSPYANIPPGDCLIIEFDQEKETTDRICSSYSLAIERGDLSEK